MKSRIIFDNWREEEGRTPMIIPLNIVTTYPVRWTKYKVFRDFIQNFYDSVGYGCWKERFHYEYDKSILRMWIEDVCFNYEWLLHIGASTKTSNSLNNAGYFGEGFKIASLCAIRDYGWQIKMSSGDWKLSVMCVEQQIDNSIVHMLAYDVQEQKKQKRSCLELSVLEESDFLLFKEVLSAFFYPENPIIGEKIWEGREGAVYTRSENAYESGLPYTAQYGRKGAVFCAYQLLGSNPFDLVVCLHNYKKEDRERNSLYSFEVVSVFKDLAYYVDSYGAMCILEKMRRYWNSRPKKHIDIDSWSPVIDSLIYKVMQSKEITQCFREKYPNLLSLTPIYSIRDKNRRGQARSWLSGQNQKYLLVKGEFQKLGYKTLEELCEKQGGFVVNDQADYRENKGFAILESVIKELYIGFFESNQELPERRIISNESASYHGMAKVYRKKKPMLNNRGLMIRYDIREIYLKKSIFEINGYFDALATYVHEMCHVFGGDASNAFSQGLTLAMEILLSNSKIIEEYRQQWLMLNSESKRDLCV